MQSRIRLILCIVFALTPSFAEANCLVTCIRTGNVNRTCFKNLGWLTDVRACEHLARTRTNTDQVCSGSWVPLAPLQQGCENPEDPPAEPSR